MNALFRIPLRPRDRQRGFSLLEIMVGVAIGLIGIVVIFQVLAVWETRKRTTTSGSDAQIAGTIAMFNLERDLKLAGYGFGRSTFMGCTVNAYDALRAPPNFTFALSPVVIAAGAGGAPDTLTVLWGNSAFFVADQTFTTSSDTTKRTRGRTGFQKGDLIVAAGNSPAQCVLAEVTQNDVADGTPFTDGASIGHASMAYTNFQGQAVTARYNNPAGPGIAFTTGSLYNLGPAPQLNTWQIRNVRTLASSEGFRTPTSWTEVAEGIVDLQAQYGYDDNGNNQIECPAASAPPVCEWTAAVTSPPLTSPINWSRVRAIRVALLARSQQYDKDAVTTTAPTWAGGAFVMRNVDGSADSSPGDANDWRHYRYRVYQAVVPLRNLIWGTLP